MNDRSSLRWAEFILDYGPRFAPIIKGMSIGIFGILIVYSGVRLVPALRSLAQVRAQSLVLHAQSLQRGWAWSHADFSPAALAVEPVEVLSTAGTTQWVGALTNTNAGWIARARVQFTSDTVVTDPQVVMVWPNSTQPFIVGGVSLTASRSVQAVVGEVQWQQIGSIPAYARVRESPIQLVTAKASTDAKEPVLSLEIRNTGSLGYRDLLLLVRWEEGRRVTGAAVVPMESLAPQEVRNVTLRVDHPIAGYAQYHVDPLVDLTDPLHYFVPVAPMIDR